MRCTRDTTTDGWGGTLWPLPGSVPAPAPWGAGLPAHRLPLVQLRESLGLPVGEPARILVVMGFRAGESDSRADKPVYERVDRACRKGIGREDDPRGRRERPLGRLDRLLDRPGHPVSGVFTGITYVIPCGAGKIDVPAPARDLYTGSMFRHTLENALRAVDLDAAAGLGDGRVLILSAKYGLVDLDTVLEPYDLRMGDKGSVTAETLTAQALALGIDWGADVYALLPRPYLARLDEALRELDVYVQDVYEVSGGILGQKRINVHVGRADVAPSVPDGPGPTVWLGGDVHSLWWGVPLLINYGRLRNAAELPAARAPWVLDSRGFNEIREHGRWTIPAGEYAADIDRYADEIGHLTWAAPQDWPCAPALLELTGLTEADHQRRTIDSVIELRGLVRSTPVICVVTGTTVAGYLRHIEMYREAGIDLTREAHVIGVGALVGRAPREVAAIVRALRAAGLERLHGFGVKGPALDLIGRLLESIDSASWSREARHRTGECPHGLTKWESNCPQAAREWALKQRARAAGVLDLTPADGVDGQEMLPFGSIGVPVTAA